MTTELETIMAENENVGWTWAVCTKCGKLWQYFDKKGKYNDDFPKLKCPSCKAQTTKKKNKTGRGTPDKFLKDNGVTDKEIISEFKKIYRRYPRRRYENILKDAIEVVGYKRENRKEEE